MSSPERVLRNTQKADLYSYLHSKSLSPEEDFTLTEDNPSVYIRHRFSDYGCIITVGRFSVDGYADATYRLEYSPGRELLQEEEFFHTWNSLLKGFDAWIDYLVDELETPDLWSTVSDDTQLVRLVAHQDNAPFTTEEQLQVRKALGEIKAYLIKSHNLTEAQTKIVEARFDYMEEAAGRLGRKDWTGIFVSSLIGIATTLTLSADSAKDLIRFAGQIVKQFLGTMLYLAGPH